MEVRVSKISRLGNFQCMKRKQGENITVKKVWTCNVNYKNLVKVFECFLPFQNILKLINKGEGKEGGASFQFNSPLGV